MKKKKVNTTPAISLNANYDPDSVITVRQYGVSDLKRYISKIRDNIKVFEDAITKERTEMNKTQKMIDVLESDIKEAKRFKKLKKTFGKN